MEITTSRLILDCTLRDGGYVNDWEFDVETAIRVRDALYESGIRYIELGLMAQGGTPGKHTKFATFDEVRPYLAGRKADCHYSLMLTQAEYEQTGMEIPCKSEDTVDLLRLAFFKAEADAAMETAKLLKEKGYTVFFQAMATFMYSKEELATLLEKVNALHPAGFYMVDSFSTMYHEDIVEMENLILSQLDADIMFGFHAHNNIQMAMSNVISFFNGAIPRTLIADGSIYGMGRGAGNAPVELIMEYCNKKLGTSYDIKKVLLAFEQDIAPIFEKYYWGYSVPYYLTASKNMNSVYAWYLGRKGIHSIEDMDAVLDRIPKEVGYTLVRDVADQTISTYLGEKE